jgi:hypothetical protein
MSFVLIAFELNCLSQPSYLMNGGTFDQWIVDVTSFPAEIHNGNQVWKDVSPKVEARLKPCFDIQHTL